MKKDKDYKLDSSEYILYSILYFVFSLTLLFLVPIEYVQLAGIVLYLGDYNYITKPRIRDTNLNYKWRYLFVVPALFIFLKIYLAFKDSKQEEIVENEKEINLENPIKCNKLLLVRVKKSGRIEEIKNEDWQEILKLGNEDKFEIQQMEEYPKWFKFEEVDALKKDVEYEDEYDYDDDEKGFDDGGKGKSKIYFTLLLLLIAIPLIYMGIKQKERKGLLSTIEKAENHSLILSEEKKRIASEKRVEALKTKRADFENKKEELENNVANWESETSSLKKQIHDIKANYGHFRGGEYTQLVDFSLADKQALRQLLKEGEKLEYGRRVLTTSQKDLFYLFKSFEKEFYENETYKYQDGTYRHQMLNEITQIDDVLKISIFNSFDLTMLSDMQERQQNKAIVKNAEYYLELATERMKVDESGRFDMTNKDLDYVVENINKSLDLDSDFFLAYLIRGNAYYYMQEYRKSMKDYKKITRVPKYRFESTEELSVLSEAYFRLGNAKLKLKLNPCREFKKACDLGEEFGCDAYDKDCK